MSKKRNYKVYVHINKINGKRYYGITKQDIEKRWLNGKGYRPYYDKKGYKHGNEHFWNSICKYGWNEGFEHIVIAKGLSEEEAKWLEVELIKEWDTTNQDKGYNITLGGEGTSGVNRKDVYIIELDMTFDSVTECAEYLECDKNNISYVLNGKGRTCKGYHVIYAKDKDNKDLIEEVMSYDKSVYIIELDKEFDSINDCAEYISGNASQISSVLAGRRKTCKGYHLIWAKDNKELINEIMKSDKAVYIIELDKEFKSINDCAEFLECSYCSVYNVLGKGKTVKGYHVILAKDRDNKELINEVMKVEEKKHKKHNKDNVYIIELDMIFNNTRECAEFLECSQGSVSNILAGRCKTCKGYHIIYAKDRDKLAS